jgi:hypothetical protein
VAFIKSIVKICFVLQWRETGSQISNVQNFGGKDIFQLWVTSPAPGKTFPSAGNGVTCTYT